MQADDAGYAESQFAPPYLPSRRGQKAKMLQRPLFALRGEQRCTTPKCIECRDSQRQAKKPTGMRYGDFGNEQHDQLAKDRKAGHRQPEPALHTVFFPEQSLDHAIRHDDFSAACAIVPGRMYATKISSKDGVREAIELTAA